MISTLPEENSYWRHKTGKVYKVILIANKSTEDAVRFPVSVVYQNVADGSVWTKPAILWHRSMTSCPTIFNSRVSENDAVLSLDPTVINLESVLDKEEIEFVKLVIKCPGSKLDESKVRKWIQEGTEFETFVSLYSRPEELGLIKCVGSYKWEPTELLVTSIGFKR